MVKQFAKSHPASKRWNWNSYQAESTAHAPSPRTTLPFHVHRTWATNKLPSSRRVSSTLFCQEFEILSPELYLFEE